MDYLQNDKVKFLIKFLISLLIIYTITNSISIFELYKIFSKISFIYWIGVVLLYFTFIILAAYKWRILLKNYSFFTILKIYFISLYYGVILPGQIAGEGSKIYYLGNRESDYSQITASVIFDKLTSLVGVIIISILGLYFSYKNLINIYRQSLMIVFFTLIISLLIIIMVLSKFFLLRIIYLLKKLKLKKILNKVEDVLIGLLNYQNDKKLVIINIFWGFVLQTILVTLSKILGMSMMIDISFWDWSWIYGFTSLALILPITIAGFGMREGVLIGFLGLYNISRETALLFSLSIFFVQLIGVFMGFILVWWKKI